jgi:hypothetical protein
MDKKGPPSNQDPEISFRPVTEGLGFHPFSDGLPYAPMVKSPRLAAAASPQTKPSERAGMGATAAGPPRFIAPPLVLQPPRSLTSPGLSSRAVRPPANSVDKEPSGELQGHPFLQYGYPYLCRRALAYCFDAMFNILLCALVLGSLIWRQEISPEIFLDSSVLFVSVFTMGLLHWALMTVQEVVFKTTLGKRIFGMIFEAHGLLLLVRAVLFIPSVGFFGLGILWGLFDRQKACWHDKATQVQPVEIARY